MLLSLPKFDLAVLCLTENKIVEKLILEQFLTYLLSNDLKPAVGLQTPSLDRNGAAPRYIRFTTCST